MSRLPVPTYVFALVVVRLGHRFLLVHERKHGQLYYLPAGRVEPGESIVAAAHRETLEEAGLPIDLAGILRIEHSALADGSARMRVFFLAYPRDDTPPKSVPDAESLGAVWVSLDELSRYPLRGDEVSALFRHVAEGGPVYPLSLLCAEGAPWTRPGAGAGEKAGGRD
ncbi:MAG: NUDIX domain-containing protein [Polyangia bacterium]